MLQKVRYGVAPPVCHLVLCQSSAHVESSGFERVISYRSSHGRELKVGRAQVKVGELKAPALKTELHDIQVQPASISEEFVRAKNAEAVRCKILKTFCNETHEARMKLAEAREALSINTSANVLARDHAKLSRLRYAEGLSSLTGYIDAEHALKPEGARLAQPGMKQFGAILLSRHAFDLSPINIQEETI